MKTSHDVTQLLLEWSKGNGNALDELLPLVYRELQKIAHRYLSREQSSNTLQTTALVHEAFLKLVDQNRVEWQNRAHFFGVAAQAMRRILVDNARQRLADKRGGGVEKISLEEGVIDVSDEKASDLIELDAALQRLCEMDEQKSRLVELRYFGGLSIEETAEVLDVSIATVNRQWRLAKAWLYKEISAG
ncbi:MAG: sigma-70 family RNA polymerase sigma factor [Acidobacteria bacterium]|nr:sigma-70 family RNA polymerase sigma factor [Acidobacteriota bacterium]MCA1638633.1 sigma-70 family RNA polymerase sigma factor [Acidobacteriota bacterium]